MSARTAAGPAFDVTNFAFNGTFWTATVSTADVSLDVTNQYGSWSSVPIDEIGTRKELLPFVTVRLAKMVRDQQKADETAVVDED